MRVVRQIPVNVLNVSESKSLPFPVARVARALLTELPRLASVLPNVQSIQPLSSRWSRGTLERRDRWFGRSRSGVLQALLPTDVVTWTIRSTWEFDPYRIDWTLEPVEGILAVEGSGSIRLDDDAANGTQVAIVTQLRFGEMVRALPSFGRARVERVVGELFRTNVGSLFAGAGALLDSVGDARATTPWRELIGSAS